MTRLTEAMVLSRAKQDCINTIKQLNLWGKNLTDVSVLRKLTDIELLALSVNKISKLDACKNLMHLETLYLRKNDIQDVEELIHLQSLPELKYIWLDENPFCEKLGNSYRLNVLRILPNLKRLDDIEVTQNEVEKAMALQDTDDENTVEVDQQFEVSINNNLIKNTITTHQSITLEKPIKQYEHVPTHGVLTTYIVDSHDSAENPTSDPVPSIREHNTNGNAYNITCEISQNDLQCGVNVGRDLYDQSKQRTRNLQENNHGEQPKPFCNYHRRLMSRNANLLSATLCLIKELDYQSLAVVENTVHCQMRELRMD